MRIFTIEQYKRMSKRFNQMTFKEKITTIQENKDILSLCSDGNWWGVKVKDDRIDELLVESESEFLIKNEWSASEMFELVSLLGIDNGDI